MDTYSFLERPVITNDVRSLPLWRLVRAEPRRDGPLYTFRIDGNPKIERQVLYLARNYGGTIRQLRRRNQAIERLRDHANLLRMLADPIATSRYNQSELPKPKTDIKIDNSKVDVLRRLWQTQPLFAIQGPPGTGKTTLIQAFLDRLFSDDRSAQVLLTAHSHHTVDDVKRKVAKVFAHRSPSDMPIILRLGQEKGAEHLSSDLTMRLLKDLASSAIGEKLPNHLRSKLDNNIPSDATALSPDARTVERLVQEAANLTFSTLNDGELAEIASTGRHFDWSIIEEAAKAHGFDMALALQESHRLLLIGDHRQLPPFNSEVFLDILSDALRVQKAFKVGSHFAPSLVDESLVEDDDQKQSLSERCDNWRRNINLFGSIFDACLGDGRDTRGPAATLTDQHRMHPHIAELVGNIFYKDDSGRSIIKSPKETQDKFCADPPYLIAENSFFPAERIVWLDVPYVQKKEFSEGEKDGLFVSQPEVDATIKALGALRPRDSAPCEVQILSPYNDQKNAISSRILERRQADHLDHMFVPPFDLLREKRIGATVDEFQGSEADVVIVSLVRNNGLPARKSIGFLKEPNRMNVLLSRARQKLIIVGSWDFLESRCTPETPPDAVYSYLRSMMKELTLSQVRGHAKRIQVPL